MTPSHGEPDAVDVDGLRIAYRRAGAGDPLLLLHGAPADGQVWRSQLESLSDEFTVIAWDAPGFGDSDDPPETWGMREYGGCLAGFINALGLWRPHVLGHSWGSTVALELYRQLPAVPKTLVLAGGYAGWGGSLPPGDVERRLAFALDAADQLARGEWDPTTMPGLFTDAMPAERAKELAESMARSHPIGVRTSARALAECDLREALPKIKIPTLLLWGEDDERSAITVANTFHEAIASSTLVVLPGLGHEAFLEAADAFDREVRTFLRSQS